MNTLSMLTSFSRLLEERAMSDAEMNDSDVVVAGTSVSPDVLVAGTSVLRGTMYITVRANDGTVKHFRLTEV